MTESVWQALPDKYREIGEKLWKRADQGEVALLATLAGDGEPAISPVCPIFWGAGIYLLISRQTPKLRHLRNNQQYACTRRLVLMILSFRYRATAAFLSTPKKYKVSWLRSRTHRLSLTTYWLSC